MGMNNGKRVVLGFQHTLAMFGATILVPLTLGMNPQVALMGAGVGTLVFHLLTRGKVPVFLGSSFAFMTAMLIAQSEGFDFAQLGGAVAVAGLLYIAMSGLVTLIGFDFIHRLFPAIVTGPVIATIGLVLAPEAAKLGATNWLLSICTLLAVIVAAVYFRGMARMIPIIFGLTVGVIIALITGDMTMDLVKAAEWFGFPDFVWAKFDWDAIIIIAPLAFVTMIEHVGDIIANGKVVGKDFIREPGLNRTLLGDGVATTLAGLVGAPANTTYSENTGVLAVTKVYEPRILQIGAGFAILLGLLPKFGALLMSVPGAVLGGLMFILFGMIVAVGLRTLAAAQVDFNQSRNLIIVGLILVAGLGVSFGGETVELSIGDTRISGLAVAAVLGVVANLVLPKEDAEMTEEQPITIPMVE